MSLLEDVFLGDEAGEAENLERVIEGDEYEEVQHVNAENSDEDSEKEDEAQEDKRRVDPTKPKRIVKNPRFVLNPARLTGPRGIQVIPEHFKDFKFKGKGNEKQDLDMVLKRLEHWAYRLYPKFEFNDCLKKIETLGKKRPVMVHLHKIRTDQYISDEIIEQKESSDDEDAAKPEQDEFDKLLQEQIKLARTTPAPQSVKKPDYATPMPDRSITMPKATSSPSINDEQRERMLRNRKLAEERRLAKLNRTQETNNKEITHNIEKDNSVNTENSPDIQMTQVTNISKEVSKFNVNETPDSSDSECEEANQTVVADIHDTSKNKANNTHLESNQDPSNSIMESDHQNKSTAANMDDSNTNGDFVIDKVTSNINDDVSDESENNVNQRKSDDFMKESENNNESTSAKIHDINPNGDLDIIEVTNNIDDDVLCQSERNESVPNIDNKHLDDTNLNIINNDKDKEINSINKLHISIDDINNQNTGRIIENKIKLKNLDDGLNNDTNENIDNTEKILVDEEIMDIDFSDDF